MMVNLRQRLINRLWLVHPEVILTVQADPPACARALAAAAKPSLHRLHLRNLFAGGRRYYVQPTAEGFRLMSNSSVPWRLRARTTIAAILFGHFSAAGEGVTRISLRSRMRLLFFLDVFLVPLFITSVLVFAPWPPLLIGAIVAALFALSWTWHRLTAALQAAEMVFFVQKALEELSPGTLPLLGEGGAEVITHKREFREQWSRFYEQHKAEQE